jgi:hypothetical protein
MQQLLAHLLTDFQILEIKNRLFNRLGEGTQVQLRKIKSDFLKLIIFLFRICDHFFGLIGLVSTLHY